MYMYIVLVQWVGGFYTHGNEIHVYTHSDRQTTLCNIIYETHIIILTCICKNTCSLQQQTTNKTDTNKTNWHTNNLKPETVYIKCNKQQTKQTQTHTQQNRHKWTNKTNWHTNSLKPEIVYIKMEQTTNKTNTNKQTTKQTQINKQTHKQLKNKR